MALCIETQHMLHIKSLPVTRTSSTAASISLRISWFSFAISSPFVMKCSVAIWTAALSTWALGDWPFFVREGPFWATSVVTWMIMPLYYKLAQSILLPFFHLLFNRSGDYSRLGRVSTAFQRSFEDCWHGIFTRWHLPVVQPTVSKYWTKTSYTYKQ